MLTVNCFQDELPESVNSLKDYNKVVAFLKNWIVKAESPESVEKFVDSLTKVEKNKIWMRLVTILTSFLKFAIKRTEFIGRVYNDNKEQLSQETKSALLKYGNVEFDMAATMSKALEAIIMLFDNEKKGL